jgi:hypothetical protein
MTLTLSGLIKLEIDPWIVVNELDVLKVIFARLVDVTVQLETVIEDTVQVGVKALLKVTPVGKIIISESLFATVTVFRNS